MREGVTRDRALGAVSGGTEIAGGSKKKVSSQEALAHRYTMEGTIKQVSLVSDKHFSNLDVYL